MTVTPEEARAALAGVHDSEGRLGARTRWPLSRHMGFAAVQALLVLATSLPLHAMLVLEALALCLIAVIVRSDRHKYGMFVSGWRRGPTLVATIGLMGFLLGIVGVILARREAGDALHYGLVLAPLAFVVCTLGSLWWQKLYNDEPAQGARAA